MNLFIDIKYLSLVSFKFNRFVKKSTYLWNCRCCFCGDSSHSTNKARGYFYLNKKNPNELSYKCHNCGIKYRFSTVLNKISPDLYKEYIFEKFKNKSNNYNKSEVVIIKDEENKIPIINFSSGEICSKLSNNHICVKYLINRKIPEKYWSLFYWTENYKKFVLDCLPDYDKILLEEPRLVIPFYRHGRLIGVSGRTLKEGGIRYITVRFDKSNEKLIYGLERVNLNELVYITEGPLDSLFLPNAVASCDSNLSIAAKNIKARSIVLVFDNEKRNHEIIMQMSRAISEGYKIVIWPDYVLEKDINDMVKSGRTDVKEIIDKNTVSGLEARVKLNFWKRS